MVTKTLYVTRFFNMRANPYGDFDAATHDVKTLDELGIKDKQVLHETMRQDETVYGYQTYEVLSTEAEGHILKSQAVNFSAKIVFAEKVRQVKDLKYLASEYGDKPEIWKPYTDIHPDLDPNSHYIEVDGGGRDIFSVQEKFGLEVYDRKSGKILLDIKP